MHDYLEMYSSSEFPHENETKTSRDIYIPKLILSSSLPRKRIVFVLLKHLLKKFYFEKRSKFYFKLVTK